MVAIEVLLARMILTLINMSSHLWGSALFNILHGPKVAWRHEFSKSGSILWAIAAEDIRQLNHGEPRIRFRDLS
jgi:hypothetical protein